MALEDYNRKKKQEDKLAQPYDLSEIVEKARAQTPARLLAGRSGAAYRTNTQLELREAHAAARDAVRAELDLFADPCDFVRKWNLFEVCSRAGSKDEYLLRPDLGRYLNEASRAEVNKRCSTGNDLQIVIGDGLSVTAVAKQIPGLLPLLCEGAQTQGWSSGSIFVIRYCRPGGHSQRDWRVAKAQSCRPSDRRTARFGNGRKPVRIHGVPTESPRH